jgi:cytochrome b561
MRGRTTDANSKYEKQLPAAIPEGEALQGPIMALHATGAFVLIALIVLHVVAALRHALPLKDGVLRRMTPFETS